MKKNKLQLSAEQTKILQGMEKVYENLIAFKKRMGTDIVTMQGDKIVYINPNNL